MSQYPVEKTKGKTILHENEKKDIEIGEQKGNILSRNKFNLGNMSEQLTFEGKENEFKINHEEFCINKTFRMNKKSINFAIISDFFNFKGKQIQKFEMNNQSFKIGKHERNNNNEIQKLKDNSTKKKPINLEIISEQIYFEQFYSTHSHMDNYLSSFSYNSSLSSSNKNFFIHLNNRLNKIVFKKHFSLKTTLSKFFYRWYYSKYFPHPHFKSFQVSSFSYTIPINNDKQKKKFFFNNSKLLCYTLPNIQILKLSYQKKSNYLNYFEQISQSIKNDLKIDFNDSFEFYPNKRKSKYSIFSLSHKFIVSSPIPQFSKKKISKNYSIFSNHIEIFNNNNSKNNKEIQCNFPKNILSENKAIGNYIAIKENKIIKICSIFIYPKKIIKVNESSNTELNELKKYKISFNILKDKVFKIDESTQYIKTMPCVIKLDNFEIKNHKNKKSDNGNLGTKSNIYINTKILISENEEEIEV